MTVAVLSGLGVFSFLMLLRFCDVLTEAVAGGGVLSVLLVISMPLLFCCFELGTQASGFVWCLAVSLWVSASVWAVLILFWFVDLSMIAGCSGFVDAVFVCSGFRVCSCGLQVPCCLVFVRVCSFCLGLQRLKTFSVWLGSLSG
ncbi:hypothetical protein Ancab_013201, partial [Ancistrocladus abbreviatus]